MVSRRAIVVSVALVLGASHAAVAERPACFPERTLLGMTATLFDDHENEIGAMRGQTVRVVEDRVGPNGTLAEIQLDRPSRFRARVERRALFVFLRRELTIVPDESWWMTGARMRIVDGGAHRALVEPESSSPSIGSVKLTASCDRLDGTARQRLTCDRYDCRVDPASVPFRPTGEGVTLPDASIEAEIAPSIKISVDTFRSYAVRRRGPMTLVEIVDLSDRIRVRRWLPTAGLQPFTAGGIGSVPGNIDLGRWSGVRGDVTAHRTPLAATHGGTTFTTLPPGTTYRVLEIRDGQARLLARSPRWEQDRFVDVLGWTSLESLPSSPDLRRTADAVRGRIELTVGLDPKVMSDLVVFVDDGRDGTKRPQHTTTVAPDGTFYLEVGAPRVGRLSDSWGADQNNLKRLTIGVCSKTGNLSGVVTDAPALAGGADEVRVLIGPSSESCPPNVRP